MFGELSKTTFLQEGRCALTEDDTSLTTDNNLKRYAALLNTNPGLARMLYLSLTINEIDTHALVRTVTEECEKTNNTLLALEKKRKLYNSIGCWTLIALHLFHIGFSTSNLATELILSYNQDYALGKTQAESDFIKGINQCDNDGGELSCLYGYSDDGSGSFIAIILINLMLFSHLNIAFAMASKHIYQKLLLNNRLLCNSKSKQKLQNPAPTEILAGLLTLAAILFFSRDYTFGSAMSNGNENGYLQTLYNMCAANDFPANNTSCFFEGQRIVSIDHEPYSTTLNYLTFLPASLRLNIILIGVLLFGLVFAVQDGYLGLCTNAYLEKLRPRPLERWQESFVRRNINRQEAFILFDRTLQVEAHDNYNFSSRTQEEARSLFRENDTWNKKAHALSAWRKTQDPYTFNREVRINVQPPNNAHPQRYNTDAVELELPLLRGV